MNVAHCSPLALLSLALLTACPAKSGSIGDLPQDSGTDTGGSSAAGETGDEDDPEGGSSTEGSSSTEGDETGDVPLDCSDVDRDGVPLSSDNDPEYPNPAQLDADADGIADVVDLCPFVADPTGNNTADTDRDGIGNACDLCPGSFTSYNQWLQDAPDYMLVRAVAVPGDIDGDGIGDACDNCPTVPNCYGFGEAMAFDGVIPEPDGVDCQADEDEDGVGDACDPDLGGSAGFGPADDFDGDGVRNDEDGCPRTPLAPALQTACAGPEDCPADHACSPSGRCNHRDTDGDGVGDACDTCESVANPAQSVDGGMQDDDPDGDGVAQVCELGLDEGCGDRRNPRRVGYHPVAVEGNCCTVELLADAQGTLHRAEDCEAEDVASCPPLTAPSPVEPGIRLPVRISCADDTCVELPAALEQMPGVLSLPIGCDTALADAGLTARANLATTVEDTPWLAACHRPQTDLDFDGIGDVCDLCPLGWDPGNTEYLDDNGRLWPNDGAYCNGDYRCQ